MRFEVEDELCVGNGLGLEVGNKRRSGRGAQGQLAGTTLPQSAVLGRSSPYVGTFLQQKMGQIRPLGGDDSCWGCVGEESCLLACHQDPPAHCHLGQPISKSAH